MNNKAKNLIIFLAGFVFFISFEIIYISDIKTINSNDIGIKQSFVEYIGLPDLALSTEAIYIRHRTLSSSFEIFKDDPELLTYFPSTFVISPANFNNNISRIKLDD